jgi:hypothetical protein
LVFDEPAEIPDIVSDWTRPSRTADLEQIAQAGRQAALSYDALDRITRFFQSIAQGRLLSSPVPGSRQSSWLLSRRSGNWTPEAFAWEERQLEDRRVSGLS